MTLSSILNSILLPGREEEAKVLMLSLISKQHCVLIGPPGTGKSLLIKTLARSFNVPYFEYLLTKFTLPEEIFGVPNIKLLREQGEYQIVTRGKLPEAVLAFLDEIFKGSSAILNALLGILNEREFFDGQKIVKCPLWTCLGASNEVPEEPELRALWDRFEYRIWTKPLTKEQWEQYLATYWTIHQPSYQKLQASFDFNEVAKAHNELWSVDVFTVKKQLLEILAKLEDSHGVTVSDRRKGRALIALAASAILNGRMYVVPEDLLVLKYVLPEREEQVKTVEQVVIDVVGEKIKVRQQLQELIPQLQALIQRLKEAKSFQEAIKVAEETKPVRSKISAFESVASDAPELAEVRRLLDEFNELLVEKVRV